MHAIRAPPFYYYSHDATRIYRKTPKHPHQKIICSICGFHFFEGLQTELL